MYELMSGRIPYEGPDTKTTNGYVVQGNAPSPARHDASIPEPLATVTMTALQPSDKTRFRDASEAEQALREAWERCLTQGLVHPAVLAMDEMPHDKAPVRFHEPRGIVRPSPISIGDSAEVTAINDHPPAKKPANQFVIESSRGRPGDDDPTKLMVREEAPKAKPDATARGIGAANKTPSVEVKSGQRAAVDSAADTKADPAMSRAMARKHNRGRNMAFLVIGISILIAGLVGGLLGMGYIHF